MSTKTKSIATSAMLILALGILSLPALAQHEHEQKIHVGKTGDTTFSSEVKVGDISLPAGAYRFKHVVEGDDHVVTFTKITTGKEVARVKCKMEPLGEKAKQTMIFTAPDANGKDAITQIVVAGENVKHVF